ncbi:MAG: hypothetical protein ACPGOY_04980 [Rhodospirillaceae bacterium]
MDAVFAALEALPPIAALRFSGTLYALVNGSHILGIALLVGGVLSHHVSVWTGVPAPTRPLWVAVAGLLLALGSGAVLFATRASEYAANPALQIKLILISAALTNVFVYYRIAGPRGRRVCLILSAGFWITLIYVGRWIAFVRV